MIKEDLSPLAPNFNPWLEIWYRPRTTIRRIIQVDPKRDIWLIAALFGYARYLTSASAEGLGDTGELLPILGVGFIFGAIGGVIRLGVLTFVLGFIARRLGGEADNHDTAAALAWSHVPIVFTLLLFLVQLIVLREQVFMSDPPILAANPLLALFFIPIIALHALAALWQTVLTVLMIAEVHRFSIWRGIATVVIPVLLPLLFEAFVLLSQLMR